MATVIDDLAMLIDRGGYVMVPLLGLSIISLALIAERCWFWAALHNGSRRSKMALLHDALRQGNVSGARRVIDGDRSVYGLLGRRLLEDGAGDAVAMETVEALRPRIDRFMVSLSTIITAAPLLGILGTVIGIIRSFNLLGEQATLTDPRLVATGIAEALLTTALGLVVALMTLFPYMVFRGQVDRAVGRMESLIAAAQEATGRSSQATQRSASAERGEPESAQPKSPDVVTTGSDGGPARRRSAARPAAAPRSNR